MVFANSIAWTVYAGLSVFLISISFGLVRHYQSQQEKEWPRLLVAMTSVSVSLMILALIPLDAFLVSYTVNSSTGLKKAWADETTLQWIQFKVELVYYLLASLVMFLAFFLIPYVFTAGIKSSAGLGIVGGVLFLSALFFKPHVLPHYESEWYKHLLTESSVAKAFWFVITCLLLLGLLLQIVFTAPGLSLLPIELFRAPDVLKDEKKEIQTALVQVRERKRQMSTEGDHPQWDSLERQENDLLQHLTLIETEEKSWFHRAVVLLRPFKVLIGIVLLMVTVGVMVSVGVTSVDKVVFSICGIRCGYIIGQTTLFNPINFALVHLVFPFNWMIWVAIMVYSMACTLLVIRRMGFRFLWATLYRVKQHATAPQGLVLTGTVLMLSLLTWTYTISSILAPGYTHFGNQVYCNHTQGGQRNCTERIDKIFPCDIWAPIEICTPTVTSTLIDRMLLNSPFLASLFYYGQWLFMLSFLLGCLMALSKSDLQSEEVEERQPLLVQA